MPLGANDDWINIAIDEATETTLVLCVLGETKAPMQAGAVADAVLRVRPSASRGGISNIGKRLADEGLIARGEAGWALVPGKPVPAFYDGRVWGPLERFVVQEVAAYRRDAIMHVLRASPDGLQIIQITNMLRDSCPWLNSKVPTTKDLVKMDMTALAARGEAKRVSKKWRVA